MKDDWKVRPTANYSAGQKEHQTAARWVPHLDAHSATTKVALWVAQSVGCSAAPWVVHLAELKVVRSVDHSAVHSADHSAARMVGR